MSNWLKARQISAELPLPELEIPRRFQAAQFEQVPYKSLITLAQRYGKDFWDKAPLGIAPLFVGAAGTYKTYTAAILANAIHKTARIEVGWCSCASDLTRFDREAFSSEVKVRIKHLKEVPFLVMDDFTQFQGARQLDTLIEIGSVRFENLRPTLWTGNVTITKDDTTALTEAVGACLSRRILETSEGYRIMVNKK